MGITSGNRPDGGSRPSAIRSSLRGDEGGVDPLGRGEVDELDPGLADHLAQEVAHHAGMGEEKAVAEVVLSQEVFSPEECTKSAPGGTAGPHRVDSQEAAPGSVRSATAGIPWGHGSHRLYFTLQRPVRFRAVARLKGE